MADDGRSGVEVMKRRNTEALLRRIKKRLDRARKSLIVEDTASALEEIDWAIIELEGEVELAAKE